MPVEINLLVFLLSEVKHTHAKMQAKQLNEIHLRSYGMHRQFCYCLKIGYVILDLMFRTKWNLTEKLLLRYVLLTVLLWHGVSNGFYPPLFTPRKHNCYPIIDCVIIILRFKIDIQLQAIHDHKGKIGNRKHSLHICQTKPQELRRFASFKHKHVYNIIGLRLMCGLTMAFGWWW